MFRSLLRMNSNANTELGQRWVEFLKVQRRLISGNNQPAINNQSAADSNENDLTNNPYYSKYADKLKNAKLETPNHLKPNLDKEEQKTKEKLSEFENKLKKKDQTPQQTTAESSSLGHRSSSKPKTLNDIIKLELIKDLNEDAIKQIWFERFKKKEHTIYGCLNAANYDVIKANFMKHPVFIFLLPVDSTNQDANSSTTTEQANKNNYQFVLVQFDKLNSKCYFTPLSFYHAHKENAPAALSLNYYDEIKQDKNLVLMEGEYDNKIFNLLEAQCLVNQIQIFYSNKDKTDLLNNFTNNPATFDYMTIVNEFEKCIAIKN